LADPSNKTLKSEKEEKKRMVLRFPESGEQRRALAAEKLEPLMADEGVE
jgi:hypothetical protein